ncbi:metal-dependent hydrolase [Terrihabitans sp. B22-R8]|uniref:metal-dependent hydrolase n=1 Tax=Terrihabitans sp. B22-R8 TaxID=3425128 RepID=UPI00403D0A25
MQVTWYGHSAFKLQFGDVGILFDPFITGSGYEGDMAEVVRGVTHILLTHGHSDHVGDTVEIEKQTGAVVVSNFELVSWLGEQGVQKVEPMNTGGSIELDGFTVTLTQAFHSSGEMVDGVWAQLGHPNGIIVEAPGEPTVYHLGDTGIFGDMKLINELYQPKIGFVPIGDRFTMGARTAAYAVNNFFDFDVVVPCHYATFGLLAPNADSFVDQVTKPGTKVVVPEKGKPFEA